jgi:GDP-4-dehydro-6-deoxy-D-mannose reductase
MRALITGVTGFVGRYLARLLVENGYEVWGTTRNSCPDLVFGTKINIVCNNLLNENELLELINLVKPDHIYHLAGQSNVKKSWENRVKTFEANVNCTINLYEAVRKSEIVNSVKFLTVGSSEEYGKVSTEQMPINEKTILNPISPYGISKATVAYLTKHYHSAYGIKAVHVRPFNHIGPGQNEGFVVTDFSKQIVDIEKELKENTLYVGNLDAYRDFTDVRDIVEAYYLLLTNNDVNFGDIYNVCSNNSVSIQEVLNLLIKLSKVSINVQRDLSRMRPADIPLYIGNNSKISDLGWKPKISLEQTLAEVMLSLRNEETIR